MATCEHGIPMSGDTCQLLMEGKPCICQLEDEIKRMRTGVVAFLEWWDHGEDEDRQGAFATLRALAADTEKGGEDG